MPRPRKKPQDDDDPQASQLPADDDDGDEELDETEVEDAVEDEGGSSGLTLRILEDRVEIDLPRDGNEKKTLDSLGKLLDGMD